ncbi:MAG: hypothetical protein RL461_1292, partial [Planctomycetota bacterium]
MNDRTRLALIAALAVAGCNGRDYVDSPVVPEIDPA